MSSVNAWRTFVPSSSLDSVRQSKDRQKKMSSYFTAGLPYSRYHCLIDSISSSLIQIYGGQKTNRTHFLCQRAGVFFRRREMAGECWGW